MFVFVFVSFLVLIFSLTILSVFLRRKNYSARKKRYIFSFISTFIVFPVLIPAGTIVAVPVPNIVVFALSIYSGALLDLIYAYFLLSMFNIISFSFSFFLMMGLSQMIFYEYKAKNGR